MLFLRSVGARAAGAQDYKSGSFGFSLRGPRFYAGRTYYAKQAVWVCDECKRKDDRFTAGVLTAGVLFVVVVVLIVVQISRERQTGLDIQQSQATNQASLSSHGVSSPMLLASRATT